MIKLSKRLKEISNYISDNVNMIDIGCDHALLDIYLVMNRENINIIASDVNKNAIENANKNIERYKVDDKIKTIITNGLNNIDTEDIDTIVISGMGAHTIVGILLNDIKKTKNVNNIIIQSNNDIDFLRKRITEIGYYIEKESLVKDAGIIYTVIQFKKGHKFYTRRELYFGPFLLKENSELFREKKELELSKLKTIYPLIPRNHLHHRFVIWLKMRMYK